MDHGFELLNNTGGVPVHRPRPRKVGERSRMRCGVSRLQSSGQQIHRQLDEITQEVTGSGTPLERHGIFQVTSGETGDFRVISHGIFEIFQGDLKGDSSGRCGFL